MGLPLPVSNTFQLNASSITVTIDSAIACSLLKSKRNFSRKNLIYRLDSTSGKTSHETGGMGSNPEPIKSPTSCQRLATAATLECGPERKIAEMGKSAHTRETPERVLSEYNEDLMFEE